MSPSRWWSHFPGHAERKESAKIYREKGSDIPFFSLFIVQLNTSIGKRKVHSGAAESFLLQLGRKTDTAIAGSSKSCKAHLHGASGFCSSFLREIAVVLS
ncbi:hypothetical protein VTO42DRAFT_2880 [Malbranchea cinnamomea]